MKRVTLAGTFKKERDPEVPLTKEEELRIKLDQLARGGITSLRKIELENEIIEVYMKFEDQKSLW